MHFADQSGLLALIGLLLVCRKCGHPQLLKMLLSFNIGLSFSTYTFSNYCLQLISSEWVLGFIHTFELHITEQVNKVNSIHGLIMGVFTYVDSSTVFHIYNAFVIQHLEFCCIVLDNKKLVDLVHVQSRVTCLISYFCISCVTMKDMSYYSCQLLSYSLTRYDSF